MKLVQLEEYCKEKAEIWMDANLGYSNWTYLAAYDSNIHENWFRVVLRVGFRDIDFDGIIDSGEDWDYHWWYQTDSGIWAEKENDNPSELLEHLGKINPTTVEWLNEDWLEYYNIRFVYDSAGVFYQIADVRNMS